ncbi:MAG: hypothetical protein HOP28_07265 [Gemmatimonadales bacterium]|nr:hypothetical protein [Gemmatimonadales bacterium]
MSTLWNSANPRAWRDSLATYDAVIARQGVAKLPDRDRWYREELPALIRNRKPAHVTLPDLVKLTEWKMSRGTWRAPNLLLVERNPAATVKAASAAALALIPDPKAPIGKLTELAGVGPATASAVLAAAAPELYPFFDELVAAQIPNLGKVAFTLGYYVRYADALRARAAALGTDWTPVSIERALWANAGGKAGGR